MNPGRSDDESVGYEQARQLKAILTTAGIKLPQLWLRYFSIGGDISEMEVDAYLHHSLTLPRLQRDLLAQAANEVLADIRPPRAPYAADLAREDPAETDEPGDRNRSDIRDSDVMDHDDGEETDE